MKFKYLVFIAFTGTLLMGCGGAEERKAAYLEKARLSMEAGDLDKARIELKNALQIDPKDARAFFQLGNVFEHKKDYRKAFGNFTKASELDPENLEYHAKIGRYHLVLAGDIQKALEIRDLILGRDASSVEGLLLKAGILLKQGDADSAITIAQDIFTRHPGHIENATFLSTLYSNKKLYDDAISTLVSGIKENSGNNILRSALANTYLAAGKHDQAEKEYKDILSKNPEVYANHLKLAMFYQQLSKSDAAEAVLRKAIEEDLDDSKRILVLAEFIQQTRGNQAAIDELKQAISKNPGMGDLRLSQGRLYVEENKADDAEKIFKKAAKDFSEDSVGIKSRVYLASLYMQKQDIDAAIRVIDDAIKISPNDSEVNFVKAKLLIVNKDYENAIISLRTVVKDDPENIEAYFLLSASHKVNGEEKQASEIIARAYENNRSNARGLMLLADYHARNKNMADLGKVVDSVLAVNADNYEALSYKSMLMNENKMYSEASSYASRMIELNPDKPNGYIQSVPLMLTQNKRDEAISFLDGAYAKVKDNARILELLVTLHVSMKDTDAAKNKVVAAIRDTGETAELYMLLAKIHMSANKLDDAITSMNKASSIKPEWNEPYLAVANVYLAQKQKQQAIDILKKGLVELKSDLKLTLGLTRIYELTGDVDSAINEYEKAYDAFSDNVVLVNNLASLLSEYRSDENSLKRAKELADKLKKVDEAVILDTVGWVYYKTGDYAEAVTVLKTVIEKSPDVPVFNYHLGMALSSSGDKVLAKTYLTNALANDSNFPGKEEAEAQLKKLQ